jgi:hypothetical protein
MAETVICFPFQRPPQLAASSLLSENLGIEDGRDFKNGPDSIANLDREMLVKRSLRACFPVVYLLLTMPV